MQLSLVKKPLSALHRNAVHGSGRKRGGLRCSVQPAGRQGSKRAQERHTRFIFCSKQSEVVGIYCTEIQDYKPKEIFPFLHEVGQTSSETQQAFISMAGRWRSPGFSLSVTCSLDHLVLFSPNARSTKLGTISQEVWTTL